MQRQEKEFSHFAAQKGRAPLEKPQGRTAGPALRVLRRFHRGAGRATGRHLSLLSKFAARGVGSPLATRHLSLLSSVRDAARTRGKM
jgi:hypothetical protein